MPEEPVKINPTGGPLSFRMRNGHANPGSYGVVLVDSGFTEILHRLPKRDFGSAVDDTYVLPDDARQCVGRALVAVTTIGLRDDAAFAVSLTVMQDGSELGTVADSGEWEDRTKSSQLVAKLIVSDSEPGSVAAASSSSEGGIGAALRSEVARIASRVEKRTLAVIRRRPRRERE
jgi:hypothetical protein